MSYVKQFNNGSLSPKDLFETIKYKVLFSLDNPDFFNPCGIWIYTGKQGKGKTLSMINSLIQICSVYPKALICTNLDLHLSEFGITNEIVFYEDYSQIETVKNGIFGVIFVFDEIQVIYNCMQSRGIPISELACFCQNRKDRRLILATTQKSNRPAKEIREQCSYVIKCDNYFNVIQKNTIVEPEDDNETNKEGKIRGDVLGTFFWFHSPKLYRSYDTYNKIEKPNRIFRKVV